VPLVAFVMIGAFPYATYDVQINVGGYFRTRSQPYIEDVRLPFFMLGVIYAGLFFLLADKKEKPPPIPVSYSNPPPLPPEYTSEKPPPPPPAGADPDLKYQGRSPQ
jgi:hypothetical protein